MKEMAYRSYYRYVFVGVIFLCTLNLEFFGIDATWLKGPLMLAGIMLVIIDVIRGKYDFKTYHLWLLLGYVLCLFLASHANTEYVSMQSYLGVGLQGVIFFLLFANEKDMQLIQLKKEMRTINKITCVLTFFASSISLLMFLFNVTLTRNGTTIGLVGNRLFGVYFNSNPAAFLACMSIVFSFLLIRNKTRFSIFFVGNIVVQFIFILLSNCRSAIIILIIMLIMMLYYTIFKRHAFGKVKKIIFACIAAVGFYFATDVAQRVLYIIPEIQGAKLQEISGRFQLDRLLDVARMVKNDAWGNRFEIYNELDEVSSSRLSLWNTSYKLWKTSPIMGIGVSTLQPMANELYPEVSVLQQPQVVHTHNFFVEALITAGITGFVLFILFFLNSFMTMIEATRKYSYTKSYLIVLMIIVVLISEFVGGFLDYGVFYTYSLSAALFWIYLGYLYWINHMPLLKLVQDYACYDFIAYDIESIEYNHRTYASISDVQIQISDSGMKEDGVYMICIQVLLSFAKEKLSNFQYRGYFDVRGHEIEEIQEYEEEMALEVYETIKDDIEVMISDSRDKIELPCVSTSLIEIEEYEE